MPLVTFKGSKVVNIPSGASILEEAAKVGVNIPYSCNDGRCGTCKAKVLEGRTTTIGNEVGLSEEEKKDGWILTCIRSPLDDIQLDIQIISDLFFPPVKLYPCKIKSINFFSKDILKLDLQLAPQNSFSFVPGQYVELIAPAGFRRSYSIAGMDRELNTLEFHIRTVKEGRMSEYLLKDAKPNDLLRFQGPKGTFAIQKAYYGMDIYFLATGTGIAPIKVMIDQLLAEDKELPNSITVIWGCRNISDLYMDLSLPSTIYRYIPVLSKPYQGWKGKYGYVQDILIGLNPDWHNSLVYACGSDKMIRSSRYLLTRVGLPEKNFVSEVFFAS